MPLIEFEFGSARPDGGTRHAHLLPLPDADGIQGISARKGRLGVLVVLFFKRYDWKAGTVLNGLRAVIGCRVPC